MTEPINLSGIRPPDCRYIVVRATGRTVPFGGPTREWECRCDCGEVFDLPQKRIPYAGWIRKARGKAVFACLTCSGGKCVMCGAAIPRNRLPAVTCPGECTDARRKARGREKWGRRVRTDPDLAKRMHARRLAKAAADPEYAAKMAAWEKRRQARHRERMAADPEYAERSRRQARDVYARHAARIQAERRRRLDAMTPEERDAWAERARRACRGWRKAWRSKLTSSPEEHERYKQVYREYRRLRVVAQQEPPPVRTCCVCGTTWEDRKYKVLCDKPECHAEYKRNAQVRSRAKAAFAAFDRVECELLRMSAHAKPSGGSPDGEA